MSTIDNIVASAEAARERYLEEFLEFLRIPSISTLSEHKPDIARCAEWLTGQLSRAGMKRVEIMPTGGHPLVYGECLEAPGKPTVLIYGHYDVQPADPLDEWESEPFNPTVKGDDIVARGASDMKGQVFAILKAVEALSQAGTLPVNIKFFLEGEEEVGSPNLAPFMKAHTDLLACDFALNCDTGIESPTQPSLTVTLRGLAYYDLIIRGPKKDLHSGMYGGAVHNPAQVLCELVAGMHDAEGRVTLPGFYDSVRDLSPDERAEIAAYPHDESEWMAQAGVAKTWGEKGYSILERVGARPTLEVNGIVGGFTGEGSKTVLPAKALAKISTRLVPDQKADEVTKQLEAYLRAHCPDTCTWELVQHAGAPFGLNTRDSAPMRSAIAALRTVYNAEPVYKRMGGTVPVVAYCKEILGVDTVMMGFALPDDGIHGPNEKQHLPNTWRGIETYIRFLGGL